MVAHESQVILARKLHDATAQVLPSSTYAHYKNPTKTYTVLQLAIIEATNEPCVIYQANYGKRLVFMRPISNWLAPAEWQGKTVQRFTLIQNTS